MHIAKNEIITTTTFFKMDPATHQLVVTDESEGTVVNIVQADRKNGRVLSSIWGELEVSTAVNPVA